MNKIPLGRGNSNIEVTCTFCGTKFLRFHSLTINPKTGLPRKVVKCDDCRSVAPEILFWRHVDKTSSPKGCWIWFGSLNHDNYPHFNNPKLKGEQRGNRLSWIFTRGKIPIGFHVLHKNECHDPRCVNPDHLYIGSHSQNMLDKVALGTHLSNTQQGEKSYHALATTEAVLDIRANYRRFNVKSLAEKWGLSIATVRDIAKRRSWKHIP